MSHFNFKSLAFYGIAIASVVILFQVVTSYGEKNLHAPVAIDGRYPLSFAQEEPACLKSSPLVLAIQQSGTYLNASLLPTNTNGGKPVSAAQKKPSLAGQLTNQQVSIAGVTKTKICGGVSPEQVKIQGQVEIQGREGKNFKGKMTLSAIPGVPGEIDFTAKRQPPVKEEK